MYLFFWIVEYMKEYLSQWYVEEQGKQHGYDHHRSESLELVRSHREEDECYQSCTDITISDR